MSEKQIEHQAKAQAATESKFKSQADEHPSKMEEFKKFHKRLEQIKSDIKQLLIDDDTLDIETIIEYL